MSCTRKYITAGC